jgi:hypothetical protein
MQGLAASSKLSLTIVVVVLLLGMASAAHGLTRVVANSPDEPCMNMTLYYHDILYNGNNTANATTAAATKPTPLSTTYWKNSTYFGALMVFNDPMTVGKALPLAGEEPAARAQGFYFYDKQESLTSWFGFSIGFSSTAHKGTLNLVGADLMGDATRDFSVVGGTGDFFMARGVATIRTDAIEGLYYFRLQMDIKLYECYV